MKIRHLLLFFTLISSYVYSIESETHDLFNEGFYTKSIQVLREELKVSNTFEQKSKISYQIAYSFYAMLFVEDYKRHLDSANYFAAKKKNFSIEDKVEYAIGLIR